jgi:hypothetical protein
MAIPTKETLFAQATLKDIVVKMFDSLPDHIQNAIIEELVPHWSHELFNNYPENVAFRRLRVLLFENTETRYEYYNGGSWGIEGNYPVDYCDCKLCGRTCRCDGTYKHIKECKKHNELLNNLNSLDEYTSYLNTIDIELNIK